MNDLKIQKYTQTTLQFIGGVCKKYVKESLQPKRMHLIVGGRDHVNKLRSVYLLFSRMFRKERKILLARKKSSTYIYVELENFALLLLMRKITQLRKKWQKIFIYI
jgi:hypothetical protein